MEPSLDIDIGRGAGDSLSDCPERDATAAPDEDSCELNPRHEPARTALQATTRARIGRDGGDGAARKGLGQLIVKAMASKLNAEWGYDDAHQGTRVTMCFDRGVALVPAS